MESISLNHDHLTPFAIYFARVMADSSGLSTKSNWIYSSRFYITDTVAVINIFKLMKETEISDVAAILHWKSNSDLTNIKLTNANTKAATDITIQSADIADSSITLTNLDPNTAYTAELFVKDTSYGKLQFSTKTELVGANIIDLSKQPNHPGILNDAVAGASSGDIIVLKRNETYSLTNAIVLDKSITFMSGRGLEAPAKIFFASAASFDCLKGSQIDSVKFDEVEIAGDYTRDYVMNISAASGIGRLIITNSNVNNLRGVVRVKGSDQITVGSFIIDNSVVKSISGYGLFNLDNGNPQSAVNNVILKNSTFNDLNVFLVSKNNSASITITDNTFYLSPGSGKYLIDYNDKNITGQIQIKNTIFGKTNNSRGIRAGSSTSVDIENSFATDDNSGGITGVAKYGGSSSGLFKNPDQGDFTLTNTKLGQIGDPRWINQ